MELTDSALSKQLSTLSDAGLTGTRRASTGARRRVWVHLTPQGRRVLTRHAQALREIAGATTDPPDDTPAP